MGGVPGTVSVQLDLLRPVSDEDLLLLSERNQGYQFERTADGRLVVSPTGAEAGRQGAEVVGQLRDWNRRTKLGVVFDSSTGFRLPDGSLLSPDASWVRRDRWDTLERQERRGFPRLCPDVVFEICSPSQTAEELREKLQIYLRNGARVAVLIDPEARVAEVHRPGQEPERYEHPGQVRLDPELPGFALELGPLFEA